ncbi:hypothetical protein KC963_00585 [Candidatus Saccharibacteria bacterium]|nr:hypothetical protein [Candidatus Saccharibacteria bacterium]
MKYFIRASATIVYEELVEADTEQSAVEEFTTRMMSYMNLPEEGSEEESESPIIEYDVSIYKPELVH